MSRYVLKNSYYIIKHHGIKGQKWGVKNGPPYPIEKTHGRRKKSVASNMTMLRDGIYYTALNKGDKGVFTEKVLDSRRKSSTVKNVSDLPKLSEPMPPAKSMLVTNPGWPKNPNRNDNCELCSFAMAMREKGYDVQARESWHGWWIESPKYVWENTKYTEKEQKFSAFCDELKQHGDGAYGMAGIYFFNGGGHAIFWKNENGTTNFYDGQSGEVAPRKTIDRVTLNYYGYARLDNNEPKEEILAFVEPRK